MIFTSATKRRARTTILRGRYQFSKSVNKEVGRDWSSLSFSVPWPSSSGSPAKSIWRGSWFSREIISISSSWSISSSSLVDKYDWILQRGKVKNYTLQGCELSEFSLFHFGFGPQRCSTCMLSCPSFPFSSSKKTFTCLPKRMEKHEGPNHHHHDGCCMSNTTGV